MLKQVVLVCWPFGVLVVMAVLLVYDRGCLWSLLEVGTGWFGRSLVLVCWRVGVLVCWGWHVSEMKRAGDLFPNHPKERTDSVRQ